MENPKKQQSKNNTKTSVLRHSNTKVIPTYQEGGESRSEIRKKREKEKVLSPTIHNRFADFTILFLGTFSRFGNLVRRGGCGDLFALFVIWLHILASGSGGLTLHGLSKVLSIVLNDGSYYTLRYRVGVLIDCNLVSLVKRGRYFYYSSTRYAEKNILDFEIAKKDIVSFVASFRRVMKEQSRPGGKV